MEAYIAYLENVLGLRQVVWPETSVEIQEDPPENTARVHVLFVADQPFSPRAKELFEKMRDAMKIPNQQCKLLFVSHASSAELQVSAFAAEHVVCFSKATFEQIPADHAARFVTYSPEVLLSRPELKKEAWEDLKKVMKSLGVR